MKKVLLFSIMFILALVVIAPSTDVKAMELDIQVEEQTEFSIVFYEDGSSEKVDTSTPSIFTTIKGQKIATVHFWVDFPSNTVRFEVEMAPGHIYQSFKGFASVMNITSGLSHGDVSISGPRGSFRVTKLSGHQYLASISGMVISQKGVGMQFNGAFLRWIAE